MRQSSQETGQLSSKRRTSVPTREEKAQRVIAFLRRMYPAKTAEQVAADTGVSVDAVQKMLSRGSMPGAIAFGRMILVYGPAFLVSVYPNAPKWLDEAHRRERLAELEAEQARIQNEIAQLA